MEDLLGLRLETDCPDCTHKCCSQPFDWVFLTAREIRILSTSTGIAPDEFVAERHNTTTGHTFRQLRLPCRFLEAQTGRCTVYDSRPLSCRLFPLNVEVSTGQITLLRSSCGPQLRVLNNGAAGGFGLAESEDEIREWFADLWSEAVDSSDPAPVRKINEL